MTHTFLYVQARAVEFPVNGERLSFNHITLIGLVEHTEAAYVTGRRICAEMAGKATRLRPEWADWPLVNDYAIDITEDARLLALLNGPVGLEAGV